MCGVTSNMEYVLKVRNSHEIGTDEVVQREAVSRAARPLPTGMRGRCASRPRTHVPADGIHAGRRRARPALARGLAAGRRKSQWQPEQFWWWTLHDRLP